MERKIFYIGVRHIRSEKKQKDYYMVDYVDNKNTPKTDYIDITTYNKIGQKGKPYTQCVGIFDANDFDKLFLTDIK